MATKFKKVQYKDSNGKEPSEYIRDLLLRQINVVKLATYITQIPNQGTLLGTFMKNIKTPHIGIWALKNGGYHLYYSYFKHRNEVCFLYLLKGRRSQKSLSEAINRVKQFYNI